MRKSSSILLIGCIILLSSCSHRVIRIGHEKPDNLGVDSCAVAFTKTQPNSELIGELKLGDTGFSAKCNEADALTILRKEACALGAQVVYITDISEPDFLSSCYRCRALFYTNLGDYSTPVEPDSEKQNPSESVKSSNAGLAALGYIVGSAAGFAVGYLLVSAIMGGN